MASIVLVGMIGIVGAGVAGSISADEVSAMLFSVDVVGDCCVVASGVIVVMGRAVTGSGAERNDLFCKMVTKKSNSAKCFSPPYYTITVYSVLG